MSVLLVSVLLLIDANISSAKVKGKADAKTKTNNLQ